MRKKAETPTKTTKRKPASKPRKKPTPVKSGGFPDTSGVIPEGESKALGGFVAPAPNMEAEGKGAGAPPLEQDQDYWDILCTEIGQSDKSLPTIVKALQALNAGYPCLTTVLKWLRLNEQFAIQYACAKELQADYLAEQMTEIADDASNDIKPTVTRNGVEIFVADMESVQRSRLRVETRKWVASKLKPKKYGDRTAIDLADTTDYNNMTEAQLLARIAALHQKLGLGEKLPGLLLPAPKDEETTTTGSP